MDGNNKVLVWFVVGLVAFLAFPVVVNKAKAKGTATPAAVVNTTGAVGQTPANPMLAKHPELSQPPMLNEASLINSEWKFFFQSYKVKLIFAAGGVAYAYHPMAKSLTGVDYIEGRWRVEYDKLYLNASFNGNELNYEFRIAGPKIFQIKENDSVGELERF